MKKTILKNLSKDWTILVADGNDQSSVTNVLRQELINTEKKTSSIQWKKIARFITNDDHASHFKLEARYKIFGKGVEQCTSIF
jgi:hypothetical protein